MDSGIQYVYMSKMTLTKPLLIMLYGFPGSGKTHFANQLTESIKAAHIQGDRIRFELFEEPRYDKQENEIVTHLMDYMAEEFLNAGISVIYDMNAMRLAQRRILRDTARKAQANYLLIWFQIDPDTAFYRTTKRDRRRIDDKYAMALDRPSFDRLASAMQNPTDEEYMVISGKHTFNTQKSAVIKKLYELGLVDANSASSGVIKPGMVNLVPNPAAGRVDSSRRNIFIR